ncbi:MAG: FHIPEP family type III secretion protein [Anaerohalosphaeraceae bacterium]
MKRRQTESNLPEAIHYRLDAVFAAAALTVLAGLLIPIPLPIMDIVWVCSVVFAAAVVAVCLAAVNCQELGGFDFLVGVLDLLRIGLIAMTVRKILLEQTAGTVVGFIGKVVLGTGVITAAILAVLIVILSFWMILLSARQIRRSVRRYSEEILPVKRAGLQADLSLNVISREQAKSVLEKIKTEMRFFGSMGSIAVLMRCQAAAAVVMILLALGIKVFSDTLAGGYNAELLETVASQAAGLAIISMVPAVASAWSCAGLLRKEALCLKKDHAEGNEKGHNISLPGTQGQPEQTELLNPDFMEQARIAPPLRENIVDFEPSSPPVAINTVDCPIHRLTWTDSRDYYQQLTDLTAGLKLEPQQAVLLSSLSGTGLGVQAAVNTAIGLAGKGFKVLLIDAQPKRRAAAKAFDLDEAKTVISPQSTCIDKISVFTAGDMEIQAVRRIETALLELGGRYDKILIYGPQMIEIMAEKIGSRLHTLILGDFEDKTAAVPENSTRFASYTAVMAFQ